MAVIRNSINNQCGGPNSGATNTFTVLNSSNTASSAANSVITVGGATAGDPWQTYTVTGATSFSSGIDNSDSDKYKVSASTVVGTNDALILNSTSYAFVPTAIYIGSETPDVPLNLNIQKGGEGTVVGAEIRNVSAVPNSHSLLGLVVNVAGGDPFITYNIASVLNWSHGIDNSDSDSFKISASAFLGTNDALVIATTGQIIVGVWNATIIGVAYGGTGVSTVPTNGQLLIGNGTGYTVANLTAGTGIGISNGAGSITISTSGGGVSWQDQAISGLLTANNGYFATAAVTLTLPASPTTGDTIIVQVDTGSSIVIEANTGQSIRIGTLTSSVAGTLTNTANGDSVTLTYRSGDTTWHSRAVQGNWSPA